MNKRDLKWIALGALVYWFVVMRNGNNAQASQVSQSFDPVHNSDYQFNDFQVRFGQDSTGRIFPDSLFNGDIQSSLGFYETLGDTRRLGFDIFTSPANNIPIV